MTDFTPSQLSRMDSDRLAAYTANLDFLLNACNWLADRTERVRVTARPQVRRRLAEISPQRARNLRLVALVIFPGVIVLAGLVVFLLRRR